MIARVRSIDRDATFKRIFFCFLSSNKTIHLFYLLLFVSLC